MNDPNEIPAISEATAQRLQREAWVAAKLSAHDWLVDLGYSEAALAFWQGPSWSSEAALRYPDPVSGEVVYRDQEGK